MPVNDIYQVRIATQFGSQIAYNILHYRISFESSPGLLQSDVCTGVKGALFVPLRALISSDATLLGLDAQLQMVLPYPLPTADITGRAAGTAAAGVLPTQTCGIVTLKSLFTGRKNRGRSYTPFPSVADQFTDSFPTAGFVARLTTYAAALVAPIVITVGLDSWDLQLFVKHKTVPVLGPDLLNYRANAKWATQRRRGDYGATNLPPF